MEQTFENYDNFLADARELLSENNQWIMEPEQLKQSIINEISFKVDMNGLGDSVIEDNKLVYEGTTWYYLGSWETKSRCEKTLGVTVKRVYTNEENPIILSETITY